MKKIIVFLCLLGFVIGCKQTDNIETLTAKAEKGYASAQYSLAYCYHNGEGVEQSDSKAAEWLMKSAQQGYAKAQYFLGLCYDKGEGVEISKEKALYWFIKSCDNSYEPACELLNKIKD